MKSTVEGALGLTGRRNFSGLVFKTRSNMKNGLVFKADNFWWPHGECIKDATQSVLGHSIRPCGNV